MARMRPGDRRAAILAATVAVIGRQGIAATTVRDIAAELGTSSGLIHHYFDTMDDLLAGAFVESAGADLGSTVAAVSGGGTALERLELFLGSYSRADTEESGGMQMWLDAWAEAARRPAVRRASRALNVAWHALLVDIISAGVEEGSVTTGDPDASAWRILSLLDGLALQTVAHGDVISASQADAWSREGVFRELGIRPGTVRADEPHRIASSEARVVT